MLKIILDKYGGVNYVGHLSRFVLFLLGLEAVMGLFLSIFLVTMSERVYVLVLLLVVWGLMVLAMGVWVMISKLSFIF